jgi:hypothetical protein
MNGLKIFFYECALEYARRNSAKASILNKYDISFEKFTELKRKMNLNN